MGIQVVLQQMLIIAVMVTIGILLGKKGVVDSISSKSISTIVVDVCNPALMLTSVIGDDKKIPHDELLTGGVIAVIFYAVLVVMGFLLPLALKAEKGERRFYNMMCVYTNVGFIGIPVAHAILPEEAMFVVLVCNVLYSLLFYTHGVTILSGGKDKVSLKKAMSPGTIAALISIVILWFDFDIRGPVADLVSYVGGATVFLSMTLLGVSIARADIKKGLKNVRIWGYVTVRMLMLPAIMIVVFHLLNVDPILTAGMCLMAAMPVGNLPLIQAEKTGEDTTTLSHAIAISTVVSMVSIPLVMIAL